MKKFKKILACLLAVSILLLSGCGTTTPSASSVSDAVTAPETTQESAAKAAPSKDAQEMSAVEMSSADEPEATMIDSTQPGAAAVAAVKEGTISREKALPLCEEQQELSWWLVSSLSNSDVISDYNDHRGLAYVESLTNVHMNITQCNMLTAVESFSLMVAGGDTTDLIGSFETYYTSGIENAIEEEIIINLLDYMDDAPIYQQMLESDQALRDRWYTASGMLGTFNTLMMDYAWDNAGTTIRGDWLEELALETPVTYDDMHDVLMAIKSAYDPKYCLNIGSGLGDWFQSGFGLGACVDNKTQELFYLDGDTVVSSFTSERFRDYLTMLNQWFNDGLISRDYVTVGDMEFFEADFTANVANGEVAVMFGPGGLFEQFEEASSDENFELVALPTMRRTEDSMLCYKAEKSLAGNSNMAISTTCENIPLAMAWCDFWYTEEGSNVSIFGVENESFTKDDSGKVAYTELLTNNPDGYELRAVKDAYTISMNRIADENDDFRLTWSEAAQANFQIWTADNVALANGGENAYYPSGNVTFTAQENEEKAALLSDIITCIQENVPQFVLGTKSMDEYDAFCGMLEALDIARVTEIYQAAYDRYIG